MVTHYLDNNATTRVDAAVLDAMLPFYREHYGNPSSLHRLGVAAERALAEARERVANALKAQPHDIIFTSGGTEANNLALRGATSALRRRGDHVVTTAVEHPSVQDVCQGLEEDGLRVTTVPVDAQGRLDPAAVVDAIEDGTILVSVMHVQNETGAVFPVEAIARRARARNKKLLVHSDGVQAFGKLPAPDVDLYTISAHKVHGPKGAGALLVRHGARWKAPFPAAQERSRRAGTEAVALLAGFAAAARAAKPDATWDAVSELRDRLERTITGALGDVDVNAAGDRTPNTSSLLFRGIQSDQLLALLDRAGIDASNGSACSSGTPDPSHVLLAMGLSRREALSCVRFSLSRFTTSAEIDRAITAVIESVETLRARSRQRA